MGQKLPLHICTRNPLNADMPHRCLSQIPWLQGKSSHLHALIVCHRCRCLCSKKKIARERDLGETGQCVTGILASCHSGSMLIVYQPTSFWRFCSCTRWNLSNSKNVKKKCSRLFPLQGAKYVLCTFLQTTLHTWSWLPTLNKYLKCHTSNWKMNGLTNKKLASSSSFWFFGPPSHSFWWGRTVSKQRKNLAEQFQYLQTVYVSLISSHWTVFKCSKLVSLSVCLVCAHSESCKELETSKNGHGVGLEQL